MNILPLLFHTEKEEDDNRGLYEKIVYVHCFQDRREQDKYNRLSWDTLQIKPLQQYLELQHPMITSFTSQLLYIDDYVYFINEDLKIHFSYHCHRKLILRISNEKSILFHLHWDSLSPHEKHTIPSSQDKDVYYSTDQGGTTYCYRLEEGVTLCLLESSPSQWKMILTGYLPRLEVWMKIIASHISRSQGVVSR